MNLIRDFKNILLFVTLLLMFQNINANDLKSITKERCEEKNVKIKTEFKFRYKYFFFRRTNRKKVKRIDKVVDENGKVIAKIIMKSMEIGDQFLFREFHRLVIVGDEIHEVIYVIGKEKGKIIIYNFCGEKINELNMGKEELLEKYKF